MALATPISNCATASSGKEMLICIAALEAEYDAVLSQYQEAYANYVNLLSTNTANPCFSYNTGTNVSQKCYEKLWAEQGCTTIAPSVDATKTYQELAQSIYNMTVNAASGSSTANFDKIKCYGLLPSTTVTPAPKPISGYSQVLLTNPKSKWYPIAPGTTMNTPLLTTSAACNTGCSTTANCSAAVFDSESTIANKCQFYRGNGKIISGSSSQTVFTSLEAAKGVVDNLQNRLTDIINQLNAKSTNSTINTYISANKTNYITNKKSLNSVYNLLLNGENSLNNVKNSLNKYNTANTEYNEQKIFVKQQHYSYRFWAIATIIIFIIILKMVFGFDSPSSNFMIWGTIIVLASFSLSNPAGFAAMGIILILLLLQTIKDYFMQI